MTDPGFTVGARPLGYRLLGHRFAYLLHLRPAEWPICAAHCALGWLLAVGVSGARAGTALGPATLGLALWVICLNGGTLAINSAFDNDEGDVAYLRRPPQPPRHLFAFGMTLMLAGLAGAVQLPAGYVVAYAACLAMSVLYSVPPFRLKAVAGADWIINMIGFGSLTCYAGWAATGVRVTTAGWWLIAGFCPLFAALYPLTQLYQVDEDRRRGDRTLAIMLGMERSLDVALIATVVAFGCFATAAARAAGGAMLGRWAGLAVALAVWALVLIPWRRHAATWTPARHQRGMHLALGAWAVTDLAVLIGWAT